MEKVRVFKQNGIKIETTKLGKKVTKKTTLYLCTTEDFSYIMNLLDKDSQFAAIATEAGISLKDFRNPVMWDMVDTLPKEVQEVINSKEAKEILQKNGGVIPIITEEIIDISELPKPSDLVN